MIKTVICDVPSVGKLLSYDMGNEADHVDQNWEQQQRGNKAAGTGQDHSAKRQGLSGPERLFEGNAGAGGQDGGVCLVTVPEEGEQGGVIHLVADGLDLTLGQSPGQDHRGGSSQRLGLLPGEGIAQRGVLQKQPGFGQTYQVLRGGKGPILREPEKHKVTV